MTTITVHQTWLTPDRLEGDNKYFCSRCNSKQDALRIPVPTAMPPVINMHLARYEYDPITYQKKKVSDRGRGVEHTYFCMSAQALVGELAGPSCLTKHTCCPCLPLLCLQIKDLIFLDEQINFSDLLRTAQHQPAAPPDKQDDVRQPPSPCPAYHCPPLAHDCL